MYIIFPSVSSSLPDPTTRNFININPKDTGFVFFYQVFTNLNLYVLLLTVGTGAFSLITTWWGGASTSVNPGSTVAPKRSLSSRLRGLRRSARVAPSP